MEDNYKNLQEKYNEIKRLYTQLEKSEAQLKSIFGNIQDVYFETSLDGTVLEVSPSVKQVFLITRAELIGKNLFWYYVKKNDRETFINELLAAKNISDYKVDLKNHDNAVIHCSVTAKLLYDSDKKFLKIVGMLRKIEKPKNTAINRREPEKQQDTPEKVTALLQLAGEIAHDLKNQLFSIGANAHRIKKALSGNTFLMEHIDKITGAAQRSADLTKQLLAFSQTEIQEMEQDVPENPPTALDNLHVLIVDDEDVIRETLSEILTEYNMFVETFNTGMKALEYYKQHWKEIDIILLDMIMPEMDGSEVFYALRTINHQAKIILFSGYSYDGNMQELLENGALGYIEKPGDFNDLYNYIAQIMSKEGDNED